MVTGLYSTRMLPFALCPSGRGATSLEQSSQHFLEILVLFKKHPRAGEMSQMLYQHEELGQIPGIRVKSPDVAA